MDTPDLRTERLRLRRYRPEDFGFFARLFGDPEVVRYSSSGLLAPEQARALFDKVFGVYAEGRFAVWCVTLDDEPIGHAELKPRAGEEGLELVYFLDPSRWGQGCGTEVVDALTRHGETLTPRLLATVAPGNAASIRLLRKAGFAFLRQVEEADGPCAYYERRKA
ncbi:MAG: GNAT family N-acetyltransferase [Elusimicrobiota bacterium]|nr:GNAT family N-acetyltransferase [Elusimicrobiota bacterium]